MFQGFADLFLDFERWLSHKTGARVHGHLFHPEGVEFSDRSEVFKGGLSSSAKLRDRNPGAFLTNLIWNLRHEQQCFLYGPGDNPKIAPFFARDAQASLFVITGARAVPLFLNRDKIVDLRIQALLLQKQESKCLKEWKSNFSAADVNVWTLTDFVSAPVEPLQRVLSAFGAQQDGRLTDLPVMRDITGFDVFLKDLKNMGMDPHNAGSFDEGVQKRQQNKARRYTARQNPNEK